MAETAVRLSRRGSAPAASKTFAAWFGGSKVVDARGRPLVVYHGSRMPYLTRFDPAFQGSGIVSSGKAYGGFFFTSDRDNAQYYADFDGEHPDEAFIVEAYLSIRNPFVVADGRLSPAQAIGEALVSNFLEDTEYDGVVVRDIIDGSHRSDVFVVFEPTQIKSSTVNCGAYDPEDPDITC